MDEIEKIRSRRERRNLELEQIGDSKENDEAVECKADEDSRHLSILTHSFVASKESEKKQPQPHLTPCSPSVKSLRSRWEESEKRQHEPPLTPCSATSVRSLRSRWEEGEKTPQQEEPVQHETFQHRTTEREDRPVTPAEQIIGSLWDDINRELQKYKEEKKRQQDPNLSPRSHLSCSSLKSYGTIGGYRPLGLNKRGVEGNIKSGSETLTEGDTLCSSSNESFLPEKRQRSGYSVSDVDYKSADLNVAEVERSHSINSDKSGIDQSQQAQEKSAEKDLMLKRLHEMIIVQQDQICQASRALAFCRQNERFRGGREEVDAQRALLIATERRRALLIERDRVINGGHSSTNANEPKGTLTFSSISIRLSREYVNNFLHGGSSSINLYYFIVLIKCGEHVFHTSLASSDSAKTGFIQFSHCIPIPGLQPDFVCELEIYSLKGSQEKDGFDRSARGKRGTWRRMVISTPLNAYTNTFSTYSSGNAHRPIGVMDPGFQRVGHLTIARQAIGRQKFMLNDTAYPLEGSCLLSIDCHSDPSVRNIRRYSSFLSLYQIVSGFGAWNRFWCVLNNGELNFWRYPEDETSKTPMVKLELIWCVSSVTALSSSSASFPNSMQLDVVPMQKADGDKKEGIRMLFAADTPEQRDYWMENINQAIRNVNIWRPMVKRTAA